MSKIKLFYDTLSQPSRAVKLFLLLNKIPHEDIVVNLAEGEHLQPEFEKINPIRKVPVLEHNSVLLSESVAILRYLCRECEVADHWYPRDSQLQARVDEYLEWQHLNTRLFCAMYFQFKYLRPLLSGRPVEERMVQFAYKGMQQTLDTLCEVWLRDRRYVCGDVISIADLLALAELEQPRMAGYDAGKDRPIIKAYMERVRADMQPYYPDVIRRVEKLVTKYTDQPNLTAKL